MYKVSLRNKATREHLVMTIEEFKLKFKYDITLAMEAYIYFSNNRNRHLLRRPVDADDFFFDIRHNFNNYTNGLWYIDKII